MEKFDIWYADLNPRFGTEPGKIRPVIILQTNLLNDIHPSTIILPVTTIVKKEAKILRVNLNEKENNLKLNSDILIDQIRAIDKKRLKEKVGVLTELQKALVLKNIKLIVLE
ncbi:MAG: type II toxin-antitoxin system PemK/MazF family toxin [Spirochaetaceae bacterium]|nr:type II toxin-antitoxin system PemK/MazF family toxin [Spirochaetaceae bacterium]